ncbi:MAG: hypothetical protein QOD99_1734 [Chthoniobacter sp.]|nr:hypothetical protein [Chthoniobacter sp.]
MKKMKFSGREIAVLRAIDFSTGTLGSEIIERTNIQPEEVLELLNTLLETGFVETDPPVQRVEAFAIFETKFEINPSYAHDLKATLLRR